MKRLFTLCLAMAMVLSLAACGNDATNNTSATSSGSGSTEEVTPIGHPAFTTGGNTRYANTAEDGTKTLIAKSTMYDILYPEECDAQKIIQADLDQVEKEFFASANKFNDDADAYYQSFLGNSSGNADFYPYTFELTCKPLRADNGVVSILFYSSSYTGGAHGSLITFARNYDAKTGATLTMADLGADVGALALDNAVTFVNTIQDSGSALFFEKVQAENESVRSMLNDGNFYLSKDGLVLIDGQYLLQPYAGGILEFTTSYDDLDGKLNDAYALDGGVTNCISGMGMYTFDQNGALVYSADAPYDPNLMPEGDAMPEAEGGDASDSITT